MQRRLNLLLLAILLPGLLLAGFVTYRVEAAQVKNDLLDEAGLLLDTMTATRIYTDSEVRHLIHDGSYAEGGFHKQEVPSYASRRIAEMLTDEMSYQAGTRRSPWAEYMVREAVLAPMNPLNLAKEWEVDLIHAFMEDDSAEDLHGTRKRPDGREYVYLARPIRVPAEGSCATCHSSRDAAPPGMLELYPAAAAFGWSPGQVVGADVVTVPMKHAQSDVRRSVATLAISMVSIFALMFMVLNAVVTRQLLGPLRQTLSRAERMSLGLGTEPDLDETAAGEFGRLNTSINRLNRSMRRSLELAAESVGQDEPT